TSGEIQAAFERLVHERSDALFVANEPFFLVRRVQLATLAARHGLPASFPARDLVEAGGLMSYRNDVHHAPPPVRVYTRRILRGERPAELPVVQSTKFELVINAQAARVLGLTVPPSLLARADEVID